MAREGVVRPLVYWAQRKNLVYLRIAAEDVKDPQIKVENKQVYFKGVGGVEKKTYESVLNLFDEIKPDDSKYTVRDRGTEFVLIKTNEGPFWKRLLADETKPHWVKVDFNKWKDEDSDDEGGNGADFDEMVRQMQAGSMDLPGDEKDEETDEDLPDLEG